MEGITHFLLIIAGLAFGVLLISKRFLKFNQSKDFKYHSKSRIMAEEESAAQRLNFRNAKKGHKPPKETEQYSNFRQAYNRALVKSQKRSNVELNRTFWIVLIILILLILGILGFDFSIFLA